MSDKGCAGCLALRLIALFFIFTYPPFISLFYKVKSIYPNWEIGLVILALVLWGYVFKLLDGFFERFPIVTKLILYGPILLLILAVFFGLEPSLDNTFMLGVVTIFQSILGLLFIFYVLMAFFWLFKIGTTKQLLVFCLKLALIVSIVGIPFIFIWLLFFGEGDDSYNDTEDGS